MEKDNVAMHVPYTFDISVPPRKRARKSIKSRTHCSVRPTHVSDRMATLLLTTVVATFGHGATEFTTNCSIKQQRTNLRVEIIETLKDAFKSCVLPNVHWDGKRL